VTGNREFVRKYPVATKRALRAIFKAVDLCTREPNLIARFLVDRGYRNDYNLTLQALQEIPYNTWRQYDPEDAVRFYALRLHEVGMIKSTPQKLIAQGTDWRFLNELKTTPIAIPNAASESRRGLPRVFLGMTRWRGRC
jgi:NitT/TauT family transport system substrate-binding protein